MQSENLEKYIFDPKNPKKCRVYNLLLSILKEENYVTYLSEYFLYNIFEKEIITEEFKSRLWDKPDNFETLELSKKIDIFIENFSYLELKEYIKKLDLSGTFSNVFKYYLNIKTEIKTERKRRDLTDLEKLGAQFNELGLGYTKKYKYIETSKNYSLFDLTENINYYDNLTFNIHENKNVENIYFYKKIIFISDKYELNRKILKTSELFEQTSILITTLDIYQDLDINYPALKPLLLKDIKDIHLLLNVLENDLNQERSKKENQIEKEISYLDSIKIDRYFSLQNIELNDLKDKREIYIVGENGEGKTLFLQSIILALKEKQEDGVIFDFIKDEKKDIKIEAIDSEKKKYSFGLDEEVESYKNIFAYGVNRNRNDSDKNDKLGYLTLFSEDEYLDNPIKWLQYLDYKESRGEKSAISLDFAKKLLIDILDRDIEIDVTPDEVIFIEKGTKVNFKKLSDGYKSVIIWVCDLVKRLSTNQPNITALIDFRGIVLVDEVDLHLHPKWKYQIVKKLRSWLPNIQFIFTTHSPTILLGASDEAIFYKIYKKDGVSQISKPLKNIKNMMANTLITSPLFELESARAKNSDEDIDTSDDYLYSKIHKKIRESIKNDKSITEDLISDMIDEELRLFEEENEKDR